MRDTKTTIMNEIENNYLMSGYISRNKYFNQYLDALNIWCEQWHVRPSKYDIVLEKMLREEKDATREYWH